MKASKQHIDNLINAAISFGLSIPSSVNEQLTDDGFERIEPIEILKRATEILAEKSLFDDLVRGK